MLATTGASKKPDLNRLFEERTLRVCGDRSPKKPDLNRSPGDRSPKGVGSKGREV